MSNYQQQSPLPPGYDPYRNGSVPPPPPPRQSRYQPTPQPYAGNTPYGNRFFNPQQYQQQQQSPPYSHSPSSASTASPSAPYYPPPPPGPPPAAQPNYSYNPYPASSAAANIATTTHQTYPPPPPPPRPREQQQQGPPSSYYPASAPYTPDQNNNSQTPQRYPGQSAPYYNAPPQPAPYTPTPVSPIPQSQYASPQIQSSGSYPTLHPPPSASYPQSYSSVNLSPQQQTGHQASPPPPPSSRPPNSAQNSIINSHPLPLPPPPPPGHQQPPQTSSYPHHYSPPSTGPSYPPTNPPPPPARQEPQMATAPPQQNQYPSPPPQLQPPQTTSYQQHYSPPPTTSPPAGSPPPEHPHMPSYQQYYPPPPTAAAQQQTPAPSPAPAPQDPLSGLSTQMDNLNMGTTSQGPVSQANQGVADNNTPRPPHSVRATGAPLDVVPYCPESRAIDYSLYWYQMTDVPDFLACTRCHADHIKGTQLETQFERIKRPDNVYSACCFWLPRVKDILWPRAVRSGNMDALRAFITKRLDIQACKGQTLVSASEGIKWFGLTNSEIVGFIACEACYEDKVVDTSFQSRFSAYRKQEEDEKWSCDLCVPFISRAVLEMAKRNDWSGFVAASNRRMQLPKCEGKEVEANTCKWFVPRRMIANVRACEACYMDRLVLTKFESEFVPQIGASGVDSLISQFAQSSPQSWDCKLSETNLPMVFALENAVEQRDYTVFQGAADVICRLVPCTANGIIGGNWWTLSGGCENFDICQACYVGIMCTSGLSQFFEPVHHPRDATLVCDFCPASPRFSQYIRKYAEATDKGVFSYYTDFVKKFATVHPCPGIGAIEKRKWWGYPEALFCQDCYLSFVADTPLGDSVPIKGQFDERLQICQIWSPRMRKMWLEVCAAGDPGSAASETALKEFRAFGTHRLEVYAATLPQIKFIQKMKEIKMQNAMHQGLLSVMYHGMEGMAVVSGTTDGYWHGNSQVGWHETWQGAHGAQLFQNMQAGFANANRTDEWMQIAQLQTMWKQIE